MFWIQNWNNMQYVTTASFILTVASDYYTSASASLKYCVSSATNSEMLSAAQTQVNYILGQNSRGTSYFIGYGSSFPERAHHRGASISAPVGCSEGFNKYYFVSTPNPHIIEGAVTGGPDANDNYQDVRDNYAMSEPVVYNTAPLVGVLARFSVGASLTRSFIPALTNFNTSATQLGEFHHLYLNVLLGSSFFDAELKFLRGILVDIKQQQTCTWIIIMSNHVLRAEIGPYGIRFG